jgi:hypothetical protein
VKARILNTSAGTNVEVPLTDDVTVTFDNVIADGETELEVSSIGPVLPTTLQVVPSEPPTYYDISSTATFDGTVEICIAYDEADITTSEAELSLMHFDGADWQDITTSRDEVANVICGATSDLSPFVVAEPSGSVDVREEDGSRPLTYALDQNYPNPFNPVTIISYSLPRATHVRLEVFSILGQRVATLVDEPTLSGEFKVIWDGRTDHGARVASGVYIYRMTTDEFIQSRMMLLVK